MASIISVNRVAATESQGLAFTLTLSEPAPAEATVGFRTISQTALEGFDIATLEGTVTFAMGATSATLNINPGTLSGGGGNSELDENFTVEFFDPVNAALPAGQTVLRVNGTILETAGVALFVGDPVVIEGDSGTTADFEILLSRPATTDLTFSYETRSASARAGEDFTAASGTLTIAAGDTAASVSVPVSGDTQAEGTETFQLVVTPNVAAAPVIVNGTDDAAGEATILDDDTDAALPELNPTFAENIENGDLQFVVSLPEPAPAQATVQYRVISQTALEGFDIATEEGTVTIAAGATSATLNINPGTLSGGGGNSEIDENFIVEFFDPTNAVLAGGASSVRVTGVILETDGVALFVGDPVLVETDSATEARFEVRLSRPADGDLTFSYETRDGSATAGEDYTATSGTLVFLAGQTVAEIAVPVLGDTIPEPTEAFSLVLTPDLASAPVIVNGTDDSTGIATLLDDDTDAALPELNPTFAENIENGDLQFVVSLPEPAPAQATVQYRVISQTALEGFDIATEEGTVTIAAGATSATLNINPGTLSGGGGNSEIDENFIVEFFDPTNAVLAGGTPAIRVTGVILETDGVALFVGDPVLVETDGATEARFEVRLSRPADGDLTFAYETRDGSATAGEDYTATSGSITLLAGQTVAEIAVPVLGDTIPEPTEAFSLVLTPDLASAPVIVNGTDDSTGIATLLDDDTDNTLPELSALFTENIENGDLQFVVQLSEPALAEVSVEYLLVGGTAVEGVDVASETGTLTIAAGETTGSLNINPGTLSGGGGNEELAENFTVEFFNPTNAVLAGGLPRLVANGVILETEGTSLFAVPSFAFENNGEMVFDIVLSDPLETVLTVDFATTDGTATAGVDYVATSGSVTFAPGQTRAAVFVPVLSDSLDEPDETLTLTLSGFGPEIVNGTDGATATGVIVEGGDVTEPIVLGLSFDVSSVSENGGTATGTVTRTGGTGGDLVVTLSSTDETAATVPPTVTIPDGSDSATFVVTAVDDDVQDGPQATVISADAPEATGGSATLEVSDDDTATLVLSFSPQQLSEGGGTVTGTVTRLGAGTAGDLIVMLSVDEVTAASAPATVTIPDGSASATFVLTGVDDALFDGTQFPTVTASADGFDSGTASVEVLDDETAMLSVSIDQQAISEGGGMATGTVTRTGPVTGDVVILLMSSDETEAEVPEFVILRDGDTSVTFAIDAVNDSDVDGNQEVTVTVDAEGFDSVTAGIDVLDDDVLDIADILTIDNGKDTDGTPLATGEVSVSGFGTSDRLQTMAALVDANGDGNVTFSPGGNGVLDLYDPNDGIATVDFDGIGTLSEDTDDDGLFAYAPVEAEGDGPVSYAFGDGVSGSFTIDGFDGADELRSATQAEVSANGDDVLLTLGDASVTITDISGLVEAIDDGTWVYTISA